MPVHFVVTDMAGIGAVIAMPANNIAKVFCFIVFPFYNTRHLQSFLYVVIGI